MANWSDNPTFVDRLLSSTIFAERESAHEEELVRFFCQLRNPLLRYALSFGVAAQDGEEIIQEVFLALFEHLKGGKPRTNLYGWVFRVCHNLALKHLEGVRARSTAVFPTFGWEDAQIDSSLNPEELLVAAQRRQKLQAVLGALPEPDRYCVCLRAEGLRYREIAEILGMSLGAVSISLARSLARFERADQD
jgi:RNA polymerase sigma-70 factor (ECF subfamily)